MNEQVEYMSELVSSDVRPCLLTLILPDAVYPHQLGSLLGHRRDQGVTHEKNERRNPMTGMFFIHEIVDRETQAWDTQDVELLLSIFHPDMVWPWLPTNDDHDPINWVMVLGKFDRQRWGQIYQQFFQEHKLVHNKRETKKIAISKEGNGVFAVVDIDTLWVDTKGCENHWLGRVCKVYARVGREWKMTMHTGALRY